MLCARDPLPPQGISAQSFAGFFELISRLFSATSAFVMEAILKCNAVQSYTELNIRQFDFSIGFKVSWIYPSFP